MEYVSGRFPEGPVVLDLAYEGFKPPKGIEIALAAALEVAIGRISEMVKCERRAEELSPFQGCKIEGARTIVSVSQPSFVDEDQATLAVHWQADEPNGLVAYRTVRMAS